MSDGIRSAQSFGPEFGHPLGDDQRFANSGHLLSKFCKLITGCFRALAGLFRGSREIVKAPGRLFGRWPDLIQLGADRVANVARALGSRDQRVGDVRAGLLR